MERRQRIALTMLEIEKRGIESYRQALRATAVPVALALLFINHVPANSVLMVDDICFLSSSHETQDVLYRVP